MEDYGSQMIGSLWRDCAHKEIDGDHRSFEMGRWRLNMSGLWQSFVGLHAIVEDCGREDS